MGPKRSRSYFLIQTFDFGLSSEEKFIDTAKIILPCSFDNEPEINWIRPENYIKEKMLDDEINVRMAVSKLSSLKMRRRVREMFENG